MLGGHRGRRECGGDDGGCKDTRRNVRPRKGREGHRGVGEGTKRSTGAQGDAGGRVGGGTGEVGDGDVGGCGGRRGRGRTGGTEGDRDTRRHRGDVDGWGYGECGG